MTEIEFLSDLTSEQYDAVLKFDTDVSVTANAGSGKTTLLVRKYLYLQLFHPEKYNYRNVVAITFTKKAASEILKKIRETIDDLLDINPEAEQDEKKFANVSLDRKQIEILKEINRNLINLKVSTIHHFCRTIIRDFSFRLDLQPNLTILDENELILIVKNIIFQVLSEKNSTLYPHIVKVTQFLGFQITIDYLTQLFYKYNSQSQSSGFYQQPFEKIKEEVYRELKSIYLDQVKVILDELYSKLDDHEEVDKKSANIIKTAIEEFNSKDNVNQPLEEIYNELENIRTIKLKKFVSNIVLDEKKAKKFKEIIKIFQSLQKSINEEDLLLKNRISIGLALNEILSEVYKRYTNANLKENRIDNDTSIDLTVQLLQNDKVREIVQSDLSYLMIDEFQDTDDRQLEIANQIRRDGKVKLFVVGDDKQGIYGFRNADVRVFKNLRNELQEENQLNLTTSFRSKIEINAFVNDLFTPYMKAEKSEYDVDYHKIVSADTDPNPEEKRINIFYSDLMKHNPENDEKVGMDQQLLKSLDQLINERNIPIGKICILASSGGHLREIATLLEEKSLDYVILSGTGYYSKNEVKELIAFVKFIDDKDNDMLCAATLKSSLFNYTDNDLFQICNQTDANQTLWERFQTFAKSSVDEYDKTIVQILESSINLSNKLPISNILIKIIDESNWNYYYQNDKNQQSAYRNLYKFMGIARSLEDRSYGGMAQLMDLLDIKFLNNRESEEIGDIANIIKLSTIHNAKGMEYEHVIIYNFNMFSVKSSSNNKIIDEKYGIEMNIPTSVDDYSLFATKKSVIDTLIIEKQKIESLAENKRLYYVAITRAKSSLYLLVNKSNSEQVSALESILKDIKESTIFNKSTLIELIHKETKVKNTCSIEYPIHFDCDSSNVEDYIFDKTEEKTVYYNEHTKRYLGTVKTFEKDINFSATKLSMLEDINDKEKFKEIYIYGVPNTIKSNLNYDNDELEQLSNKASDGTDYGILFHSIMENIASILDQNFEIQLNKLDEIISITELEYEIQCNIATKEKLIDNLKSTLQSDLISNNMDVLLKSEKEFELKMAFGDHTLQAIYDIIHWNEDIAEIWDWKTNKFNENETIEMKAKKYKLQMDMYALFAFKYKPDLKSVNSRLFFVEKSKTALKNEDWIFTKEYTISDIKNIQIQIAEKIGVIKDRYPNTYPVQPVEL